MLIRLLTEDKNYEQVKKLVCELFDGATLIKAEGIWQGKSERSLIIEIDSDNINDNKAFRIGMLCYAIKELNQQDSILVQQVELKSRLI